ncbi:hypothetical protein EJP617_33190 [Erwinia sp. Ejp617]|nr:hypothetical protein EJP617_33190 [Erwinia sp. Ejp617]
MAQWIRLANIIQRAAVICSKSFANIEFSLRDSPHLSRYPYFLHFSALEIRYPYPP